jgi:mono/diheme cytochrome c family protein
MEAIQFFALCKRSLARIFAVASVLFLVAVVSPTPTSVAQNSAAASGQTQSTPGDDGAKPAAESGASLYKSTCSPCHQASRTGNAPDYPSLIGVSKRFTAQEIRETIKGGLGKMPAFSDLTNDEVAAIVQFLQTADEPQAK